MPGNGFFAPTSQWNAALPPTTPLDPYSANRVATLSASVAAAIGRNQPPVVNVGQYSTPFYVVGPQTPRVPVKIDNKFGNGLRSALSSGVPIPATATAASGSDGHLAVYDPSADTMWEFWQATRKGDGWHASWGGAMRGVSSNPGYYSNAVWPGPSTSEGWSWGATGTSIPVAAGLIRASEIAAGYIPHAVAASVPDACSSWFVSPAQRSDGKDGNPNNCMPEGARLRLDPTLNVDALPLSPIARVIARAAQQYGIIVRDVTHSTFTFYAEDPKSAGALVYGAGGPLGQVGHYSMLTGFPWSRLQMIAAKQCKVAPCTP